MCLPGLQALISLVFLLTGISLLSFAWYHGFPEDFGDLAEPVWRQYVVSYWTDRLLLLVLLLTTAVGSIFTPALKVILTVLPPEAPVHGAMIRDVTYRWISIGFMLVALTAHGIGWALLHLIIPWTLKLVMFFLYSVGSAGIVFAIPKRSFRSGIDRLLGLSYSARPSFNSAGTGTPSDEAKEEWQVFDTKYGHATGRAEVIEIIKNGKDPDLPLWTGYVQLLDNIAQFLGVDVLNLVFKDRTTDAIEDLVVAVSAVSKEKQWELRCITTDAEYQTISTLLTKQFGDKIEVVRVNNDVLSGTVSGEKAAARIAETVKRILTSNPNSKILVVVSHVFSSTGFVLDIQHLCSAIESYDRVMVLVDGAQAIGNIAVSESIFANRRLIAYAFCGHKWLGGAKTLGILYVNRSILNSVLGENALESIVGSRSFSYRQQCSSTIEGQTVNLMPYLTLAVSIKKFVTIGQQKVEEHNTKLAQRCREWLKEICCVPPVVEQRGGIVTAIVPDVEKIMRSLNDAGYPLADIGMSYEGERLVRICVGPAIGEWDLYEFVRVLARVLRSR